MVVMASEKERRWVIAFRGVKLLTTAVIHMRTKNTNKAKVL